MAATKFRDLRIINTLLRVFAGASRFFLFFFLVIFLDPGDIGIFGIITASLAYGSLVLGFDFYYYSNREFSKNLVKNKSEVLGLTFRFYALIYTVVILTTLPTIMLTDIPFEFSFIIFLLLLEHFNQEIYRFLVLIQKNIVATALLVVRAAIWVYVAFVLYYFFPSLRNLEILFSLWFVAALCAGTMGFLILYKKIGFTTENYKFKSWVLEGFKICIPIFIGSLFVRLLFVVDRYIFRMLSDDNILGVYVFFAGVSTIITVIAEAAIFSFYLSSILSAGQSGDKSKLSLLISSVVKNLGYLTIAVLITAIIGVYFLHLIHLDPIYHSNWEIFIILIIANLFFTFSIAYNLGLYALKLDRSVIIANVSAVVVFFISIFCFTFINKLYAVPLSLLTAFACLTIMKRFFYQIGARDRADL